MVANDFDGKATHLNGFYMHMNFEQKYPKPAIVVVKQHVKKAEWCGLTRKIAHNSTYGAHIMDFWQYYMLRKLNEVF